MVISGKLNSDNTIFCRGNLYDLNNKLNCLIRYKVKLSIKNVNIEGRLRIKDGFYFINDINISEILNELQGECIKIEIKNIERECRL